jgi:hypothetical protein
MPPPAGRVRSDRLGEALCPTLDELLKWAASREDFKGALSPEA